MLLADISLVTAPHDELVIHAVSSKPVIPVVISVLGVALIYSSISISDIFAVPPDKNWGNEDNTCTYSKVAPDLVTCCWTEGVTTYCQDCVLMPGSTEWNCQPKTTLFLEQPPTPPPSGPAAPLQDGGVLQQPPSQGVVPPLTRGQGVLPENGVLQQPPADDGTAPRTVEPPAEDEATQPQDVEEEPLCPEGQVLDEESRLCVLEEPEEQESEEPEQTEPEENGSDENGDN